MRSRVWRTLLIVATGLVAIFLQSSGLRFFGATVPTPNFLIMITVFLAFYEISVLGATLAFVLGLLLDMASGGVLLGPSAAALVVVYIALASLTQRIFVESFLTIAVAVVTSAAVARLVYAVLIYEFQPKESVLSGGLSVFAVEGVLSALLAPLVFGLLRPYFHSRDER